MRTSKGLGLSAALLTAGLGATASPAWATPVIDTSSAPVYSYIYGFGDAAAATFGQTFTATGAETQLDSFAFRMHDYFGAIDFAAYVYAWDGKKAVGPELYQSGAVSNPGGSNAFETFNFDTSGVSLVAGQQYVAFMSVSNYFGAPNVGETYLELNKNAYTDGYAVYDRSSGDFSQLLTQTWDSLLDSGGFLAPNDTWFKASFSAPAAVPEPNTIALILAGGAALAIVRRRKVV